MVASSGMSSPLFRACRFRQWPKNLLVFAAPLFSFSLDPDAWLRVVFSMLAFCLISSAVYLLNDCLDVEADRAHPTKRYRPIAAGLLSVPAALFAALLLALTSLSLAAWITPVLSGVLLIYALIQAAYCFQLKRVPLLDLFCIASGFLLRAIAGVVAGGFVFSPWFLLTVGLLALFLAIEKRKAELRITGDQRGATRAVLGRYSLPLLLKLESTTATSTFMSYALWSSGPAVRGAPSSWMLLTLPFVLLGIFRYQLLSDVEEAERRRLVHPLLTSEKPEEILLRDRGIQLTLLGWLTIVILVGVGHRQGLLG